MEMHIQKMTASVRTTDAETLLNPQVLDRIVNAVVERLNEKRMSERRAEQDRRIRPDVSGHSGSETWS
jgi:hypothetical protein